MFKRFQVFDLLFDSEETTVYEWIDPQERLPKERTGVFRVKLVDDSEVDAYFCADKISHLCFPNGLEPTYWWHRTSKEPLYNVTRWGTKTIPYTRKEAK